MISWNIHMRYPIESAECSVAPRHTTAVEKKRSGDPARQQRWKIILGSSNMTCHLPAPGNRTHGNRATIKHFHRLTNCAIHQPIVMVNIANLSISSLGSCSVSYVPAADAVLGVYWQGALVRGPLAGSALRAPLLRSSRAARRRYECPGALTSRSFAWQVRGIRTDRAVEVHLKCHPPGRNH
jgi:hypothetical protein